MKYFRLKLSIFLCLMGLFQQSKSQNIRVESKLDKTSILMGDQTVLRLKAYVPVHTKIDFPVLADSLSSKVQIVKVGRIDTLKDKDHPDAQILSQSIVITSFDAGIQMVPSFTFKTTTGNINTSVLPLEVTAVKVDTTKAIFDIKEPIEVSYTWVDWLKDNWKMVGTILIVLAIIVSLLYYFLKLRKKPPIHVPIVPQVPADRLAMEKLLALQDAQLWQKDQVKQYYSDLTDILREYLEKRFKIKAQEQTTEEILTSLKGVSLQESSTQKLQEVLLLADLVKFAKGHPLTEENEQSMITAINFIRETPFPPVKPLTKDKQ
jgi:hypothetical protein